VALREAKQSEYKTLILESIYAKMPIESLQEKLHEMDE